VRRRETTGGARAWRKTAGVLALGGRRPGHAIPLVGHPDSKLNKIDRIHIPPWYTFFLKAHLQRTM
jgi:hypothetical protein